MGYIETIPVIRLYRLPPGLITIWDILKHGRNGCADISIPMFNNNMGYIETEMEGDRRMRETLFNNNMGYIETSVFLLITYKSNPFNNNMGYIETRKRRSCCRQFVLFNNNMGYIETYSLAIHPIRKLKFNNNMGYIETSENLENRVTGGRLITIWDILKH